MENTKSHASPEIVAKAILDHFTQQKSVSVEQHRLEELTHVVHRPWSTLYFMTTLVSGESRKLVVKIVRFRDQKTAEISWQSKNLLKRGRCEFETMTRVFNHFTDQSNPFLRTLRPLAYVPEINAIVMDFSGGARMNDYITVPHLLFAKGRQQTKRLMGQAGQWLRCLHTMPPPHQPDEGLFSASDTFQALLNKIDHLHDLGVVIPGKVKTEPLAILKEQVSHDVHVWNHGDFISGNFLVFPDDSVLGLDVVMDRIDSPYYDLGRFVGDLKTRRSLILRGGRLPSPGMINSFRDAFLTSYFNGEPYDELLLALYEGHFIFREWVDMLTHIQNKYSRKKIALDRGLTRAIVNPVFQQIVKQWAETIRIAAKTSP